MSCVQVFAPVRILLTIGTTPYVVQKATALGWIKASPVTPSEVREELTERKDEYLDRYKSQVQYGPP